jgi:intracellular sulfur oxidation DsrE/DsrF family protein
MLVELVSNSDAPRMVAVKDVRTVSAGQVVFDTLPSLGMDRMTAGGVEFVICASALTAQV